MPTGNRGPWVREWRARGTIALKSCPATGFPQHIRELGKRGEGTGSRVTGTVLVRGALTWESRQPPDTADLKAGQTARKKNELCAF